MIRRKILVIFGTRPEAVKLCPLVLHMQQTGDFEVRVCVTAQHRHMLDQVLSVFGVQPHHDLGVMQEGQTLAQSTSRILARLEPVIASEKPDLILVQGDTTTTLCGALAAFYARIPAGHVEAGLRTGDMSQPWPEEMNRVLVTRLSSLHFAATSRAATNLRNEGIPADAICITGNTGIDAVLHIARGLTSGELTSSVDWNCLDPARKLVVVTAHRRENFGAGVDSICTALEQLAQRPDVQIVYPVHPNPNVSAPVLKRLRRTPNILLTEPLDYVSFVDLMRRAYLLLTDSGGVQEEAPSLGKPVIVMRETTERPEAVEAGTAVLTGPDAGAITAATAALLEDAREYERRALIHNPYGDGHASERIARKIRDYLR